VAPLPFYVQRCYARDVAIPIHLPKSSFARSLWKNGLGHTDQIAIEPPGADLRSGNYLWRISSAWITNASDFSLFPDHDRALVILSGAGVRLTHEDEGFVDTNELPPLEPYEFPGDIRSRCELLDGPVRDLSVFFRKGIVSATAEVVHVDGESVWNWDPSATWNFVFAVRGNFEVCTAEGVTETLGEGDAFRADGTEGEDASSYPIVPHSGDSVLIVVRLWR
jgi:environmental stress-induced protein Ves